ncbi:hypothetical protein [Apilactobacillus apinorum]|uniref:CHY zinc finger protein n=1 Tax=Apilactobacillus apinorum TaxID=1218495 RepID=A0ABP9ZHT9_9LACO|nr:hypothetical protein [Apilactobacillus apinorum]KOY69645.1 CHY zinc finger family protein [Apilactobacillus apinorum]CAI2616064.1 CHY zinc finger family protein [Apilactobacillus apinorum]
MIYGIQVDNSGRCVHYRKHNDVAAMQCDQCHQYYACYQCHNLITDHRFMPISVHKTLPVMCGKCEHQLTYQEYRQSTCPYCFAQFNPRCMLHRDLYFKD